KFSSSLCLTDTSQSAEGLRLGNRRGLLGTQVCMQLLKQILTSGEEQILSVGNIPEGDLAFTHQSQRSSALADKSREFRAIVRCGHYNTPFPFPDHFWVGRINLFSHIFLRPVTSFPFVAQQFVWESSRCGFHGMHPLYVKVGPGPLDQGPARK